MRSSNASGAATDRAAFFTARRRLLLSLGCLVSTGIPVGRFAQAATASSRFADFLETANPAAGRLASDRSAEGQLRYLRTLAALAAQLDDAPRPASWNDSNQGAEPGDYQIGFNPGGDPFRVLHWRLEPGAVCRPHAHTYGNVVTVGLEGEARVTNYEVVGEPDYESSDTFLVRRTVDQLLRPGDVNLVSLDRNYIHAFTAGPHGARGLDITTPLKPKPAFGTPFLDIAMRAGAERDPLFEARWVYDRQ